MLAILQKELIGFFSAFMAYVIIGFFLLVISLWMWVFPDTNVLDIGYADLQPLFGFGPYVLMFLVPAITMSLLAEERKLGTLEVLLTSAITPTQLVLGKYLASLTMILITLLLTSSYYISIYYLASPTGNIDTAAVIGSYLGLMLLAATFASIGLGASAITESQVIAFLVGVLLCFLLYQGFDAWSTLKTWKPYSLLLAQAGLLYHYEAVSRGVIDSRDLIYFFSLITLLLTANSLFLSYKR